MLKSLTISAFGGVLLLTTSAQAIQLSITPGYAYGNGNTGVSVTYKSDTGFHTTYNAYVGELITREVDTKGVPVKNSEYPNGFVTFCVDVAKTMNWSPANYSYTETAFADINASFMNPDWNNADKIQVAKSISSVYEEYTAIRGLPSYTTGQLNVAATAAQLAIWEIISDYDKTAPIDYDLRNGNFKVNSNLSGKITIDGVEYANPLLLAEHWAETASANNTYDSVIFMGGNGTSPQSLLYPQSSSTPPTAPDGGTTMLLMGLGMLGLEGLRRKVQK